MTIRDLVPWIADAFILLGVVVMTIGVVGMIRMPNLLTKLHAASKSVFLGVCSLLVGVAASGEPAFIARAILIGALLLLTTPVAAYELAKAAAREERDRTAPVAPEVWGIASSVEKRGQVSSR